MPVAGEGIKRELDMFFIAIGKEAGASWGGDSQTSDVEKSGETMVQDC